MNKRSHSRVLLVAAGLTALSGCAINPQTGQPEIAPSVKAKFVSVFDSSDPCSHNDRNIGMAAGALVGGVLGYLNHGAKGALVGAAIGTGGGYLIGHLMDSRRCKLYKIAQANHLRLISATITERKLGTKGRNPNGAIGLDVQLQNKSDEFEPGSAALTPQAHAYMTQIARQYTPKTIAASLPANATPKQRAEALNHVVLIVGHTDAKDAVAGANLARLSQERAKSVARVFAQNGVPTASIYYQGAGDALPIAPNATEEGRTENNRVQFVDVPTRADLQRYLQRRTVNPAYYQTASARTEPAAPIPRVRAARVKPTRHPLFASGYHFGGNPISPSGEPIDIGAPVEHSMFDILPAAYADTPVLIGSCLSDHPHPTTAVRNLETGQSLPPRDFVPGFYGTVWASNVDSNLVAITGATVPLDTGAPIPEPTVYIYKDYHGNVHQAPSFKARADVNIYRGAQETVYRVFLHGPAQCLDLVVPASQFRGRGDLYYDRGGDTYLAIPQFAMRR